jgi:hypothetical protein
VTDSYGVLVVDEWESKIEVLSKKPIIVPLREPQMPHGLPWDLIQASMMRRWFLTT